MPWLPLAHNALQSRPIGGQVQPWQTGNPELSPFSIVLKDAGRTRETIPPSDSITGGCKPFILTLEPGCI